MPVANGKRPLDQPMTSPSRRHHPQAILILELPLPDPPAAGWEWIEAYRRWARGRW